MEAQTNDDTTNTFSIPGNVPQTFQIHNSHLYKLELSCGSKHNFAGPRDSSPSKCIKGTDLTVVNLT